LTGRMIESTTKTGISLEQPSGAMIGKLARSGAFWTFVSMIGKYALSFLATAALSRLLSPNDFGLIGMVMTVTTLFQVFSDMGLSLATVQRSKLTVADFNNLFWINLAMGAAISICCVAASPFLAQFYRRPELVSITGVLGLGFAIGGISAQPTALMRRRMQLKQLLLFEILGLVVAAAVGVAMAAMGCGYWALVAQSLLTQGVVAVCALAYTRYIPELPRFSEGTRHLLKFGGYLTLYGVVNYFARNLDNVLVGRFWGAEQLGYYSRAYTLMMLPTYLATSSMMGVMVPALSAVAQDRQQLANGYRKAIFCIALLGLPLAVGLAAAAHEVVRLLYGPKWGPVVPLLFWLSLAGTGMPIHNTMGWLYVAVGKTKSLFWWGVVGSAILCAGFAVGVRWGALGVAISYAILMLCCLTLPALLLAHRAADIEFLPTLRLLVRPLAASLLMGSAMWLCGRLLSMQNIAWGIVFAAKIVVGAVLYGGLCGRALRTMLLNFRNPAVAPA